MGEQIFVAFDCTSQELGLTVTWFMRCKRRQKQRQWVPETAPFVLERSRCAANNNLGEMSTEFGVLCRRFLVPFAFMLLRQGLIQNVCRPLGPNLAPL